MPIKLGASHVVALLLALPVVGEDADAVQAVVVEALGAVAAVADLLQSRQLQPL